MRQLILLFGLLILTVNGFSQSKKQVKLFSKAEEEFKQKSFADAKEYYLKVLELDPKQSESLFKLGKIESLNRNEENATNYYLKAIELAPQNPAFTEAYVYIGSRELRDGNYVEAKEYLDFALKNTSTSAMIYHEIKNKILISEDGIE
ncbi:MAG: hypothetical protein NWP83_01785, partial [Spirosomaceae bacterium]|nr:hypothetical protein [Spirosomataceae bacterium]